jgi:hypothetical protein
MVLVLEGVFVVGMALTEADLPQDPTGDQQLQGAVHGGLGRATAGLVQPPVEFVSLDVPLGRQGGTEHVPPLGSQPESLAR